MKYSEFLDESTYSLPRLNNGFKGETVPPFTVPVPVKEQPKKERASIGGGGITDRRGSVDSMGDNESVMSELTIDNNASRRVSLDSVAGSTKVGGGAAKRRMTRKSIFDPNTLAINAGTIAGRNLLSGNMLDYIKEECVDAKIAQEIKDASVDQPHILLGWQVSLF